MKLKHCSSPHAHLLLPLSLIVFIFIILILSINTTAAAAAATATKLTTTSPHPQYSQHGNEALQIDNFAKVGHSEDVPLEHLMGLEHYCEDEDEECLKRRLMSEAHLDYIYTQHHKP